MSEHKTTYYQYQQALGYPVFVKLAPELKEGRVEKLLLDLGLHELSEKDQKKIPINRLSSKVLSLTKAGPRVAQQVNTSDQLDRFGFEVLSQRENYQIYTYRRLGMMVFSHAHIVWEMGLVTNLETTEELMGLRVMLNRFLSWSLAPFGVVGFWGVLTDDGFAVMKQAQSFGEVVFVDLDKKTLLSSSGVRTLSGALTITRADRQNAKGSISREEMVSFLSTATTYLSHTGLPQLLKKNVFALGSMSKGEFAHNQSDEQQL